MVKKEEVNAFSVFNRLTKTLAKDLQDFLILSPAHELSANHQQIIVHMVKVVGTLTKKLEIWATITDTQYNSKQVKLLTITVTNSSVLQITRENNTLQIPLTTTKYNELRDVVCTQAMTLLLEESEIRKTYN